jgi:hypothetical protein
MAPSPGDTSLSCTAEKDASFCARHQGLVRASEARRRELAIVYANDSYGVWDGDAAVLAAACSTTDERMEELALEYAEQIVGAVDDGR